MAKTFQKSLDPELLCVLLWRRHPCSYNYVWQEGVSHKHSTNCSDKKETEVEVCQEAAGKHGTDSCMPWPPNTINSANTWISHSWPPDLRQQHSGTWKLMPNLPLAHSALVSFLLCAFLRTSVCLSVQSSISRQDQLPYHFTF